MRIKIGTRVKSGYKMVLSKFDQSLFEALNPPGVKLEIIQFDGSNVGDIVHVRMKIAGIIRDEWISKITEEGENEKYAWFTDEGIQMPFFLKKWKHKHIVENHAPHAKIVDDIYFQTPTWLTDILLYPVFYLQFAWRIPVYKKVFGSLG